jgi:hypothetical protein
MKNFDENELIDKAMTGRLDARERELWEALLAERPELQAEIEIGHALRKIPQPPAVSSNFTALVMQEVRRSHSTRAVSWSFSWLTWPRLVRASGVAVVALGIGLQVIHQSKVDKQQKVLQTMRSFAGGVNAVAPGQGVQPEQLISLAQDFEAIRNLPAASDVDIELLAALRTTE